MVKKIVIAIDGPSSTGKSTLANQLAQNLNYTHIDTGAIYRALSLFAIKKGFFKEGNLNTRKLIYSLSDIDIRFQGGDVLGSNKIQLNGRDVEKAIRSIEVSQVVSLVAKIPQVRKKLVNLQKKLGREGGVVIDGRDIGTVVFPEAELKIFLIAPLSIRAKRRYKELFEKNHYLDYQEVFENLLARDQCDIHRKISPLKKAKDAIKIDNSSLSLQEQLFLVCNLAKKIINGA